MFVHWLLSTSGNKSTKQVCAGSRVQPNAIFNSFTWLGYSVSIPLLPLHHSPSNGLGPCGHRFSFIELRLSSRRSRRAYQRERCYTWASRWRIQMGFFIVNIVPQITERSAERLQNLERSCPLILTPCVDCRTPLSVLASDWLVDWCTCHHQARALIDHDKIICFIQERSAIWQSHCW